MSEKHTYSYVKQYFKDQDCELLEDVYVNSRTKMRYRCSCGNVSKITFSNFNGGHRCSKCGDKRSISKRRRNFDDVKKIFEDNGCRLLSTEYKNNKTHLNYICSCGNESWIRFDHFIQGKRCQGCAPNGKLTFEEVKKIFADKGCELLEDIYVNNRTKMKYKCSCGNISKNNVFNFLNSNGGCPNCDGINRYDIKDVKKYFKEEGCELLEDVYVNNHTKMKYKCSCGNISKISFKTFKEGVRCKKCYYIRARKIQEDLGNWLPLEDLDEYDLYYSVVYNMTNINYRKFKKSINPEKYPRGLKQYHIDHKYSVSSGFKNNVPPYILSHPYNLQMLPYRDNIIKRDSSSITLEELYENYFNYQRD